MRDVRVEPDEGIAMAALVWWGWLFILPVDVFDRGPQFATMERLAPEIAWGVVAIYISFVFWAGVLFHHKGAHLLGLGLMGSWWLLVVGMLFDANGFGTGLGIYAACAGACYARLFRRAGQA